MSRAILLLIVPLHHRRNHRTNERSALQRSSFRTSGNAAGTISDIAANRRPASLSTDASNLASGAQVGFNAQFGSVVVGVEGDLAFPDVSPRATFFSLLNDPSAFRQDLDWFGTARGRAGIAFDQVLIYATGGVAFGDVTNSVAFLRNTDLAFQYAGRSSDWAVGYTVGGGVEVLLPPSLGKFSLLGQLIGSSSVTVKAEYLYFDLGDKNVLVNPVTGFGANSFTTMWTPKVTSVGWIQLSVWYLNCSKRCRVSVKDTGMKAVQCRMARAALRIGVRELAEAACVSTSTISKLERGESLMSRTAQAVKRALEARGIEFFDNPPGAGLRDAPPARDKRAA